MHLVQGVGAAALVLPFLGRARRVNYVQRWSASLLAVLAVRVEVAGVPPRGHTPAMIVANHVSWLDIFAINAAHPSRFVAKAEIRRWPIIGWLCAQGGTLFLDRTRRHHIAQINQQVGTALVQGDTFAVFPEGIISTGDVLLPFHAALLQPALACGAALHPVAIRYTRRDGSLCAEADYEGEKSMWDSLLLMVTQPQINVRLQFLPPLACANTPPPRQAHPTGGRNSKRKFISGCVTNNSSETHNELKP